MPWSSRDLGNPPAGFVFDRSVERTNKKARSRTVVTMFLDFADRRETKMHHGALKGPKMPLQLDPENGRQGLDCRPDL